MIKKPIKEVIFLNGEKGSIDLWRKVEQVEMWKFRIGDSKIICSPDTLILTTDGWRSMSNALESRIQTIDGEYVSIWKAEFHGIYDGWVAQEDCYIKGLPIRTRLLLGNTRLPEVLL